MKYKMKDRVTVRTHLHPCRLLGTITGYNNEGLYSVDLDIPVRGHHRLQGVHISALQREVTKKASTVRKKPPENNAFRKVVDNLGITNNVTVTGSNSGTLSIGNDDTLNFQIHPSTGTLYVGSKLDNYTEKTLSIENHETLRFENYTEKLLASMTPEERKEFEDLDD